MSQAFVHLAHLESTQSSVPDPDPPDLHVFGPPGVDPDPALDPSSSIIKQNSKKNLDSYCLDFLSLKNDVNVHSKR
jgi:hypothetical protein